MPANRLRRALRAYRRDEARARVARFRGLADAESDADVLRTHAWLTSDEALELLAEAEGEGALSPDEALAMRAHVADVHAARVLSRTRAAWAALPFQVLDRGGHRERCIDLVQHVSDPLLKANQSLRQAAVGALEQAAHQVAPRVEDAAQRAHDARMAVLGQPSSASPEHPVNDLARCFLDRTDDVAAEALARAAATSGVEPPESWADLCALLTFPGLQARFSPRDRARRVAAPLSDLGFARELSGVKLEAPHSSVGVRARLAVLDPTRDVRVSPSMRELGLGSDFALLEGVARALGQLLLPAALPFAQGQPVCDDGARTVAALFRQLPCDPRFLGTGRTLRRELPQLTAASVCLQLAELRVAAATLVAREEGSHDAIESLAARALGVPVPRALARLALVGHVSPLARFRAGMHGLLFWTALRDAYDEDWFRNPRSAETVRAMLGLSATPLGVQLPGIREQPLAEADMGHVVARLREQLET